VSSGDLAVKQPVPTVTGWIPARGRNFSRDYFLGSQHRGWLTTLNSAAVSTELLKMKGTLHPTPEGVKHSGSDHPQGISAPSFRTAPLSVVGEAFSQPLQHRGCAE